MSSEGYGIDDELPDENLLEAQRFQQILAAQSERNTILAGIHLAHGIEHELVGKGQGFILHYLRDMQTQAVQATSKLIGSVSLSPEEILECKLAVQPYAHLMHWMKEKSATARKDFPKLEDLDALIEGRHNDEVD